MTSRTRSIRPDATASHDLPRHGLALPAVALTEATLCFGLFVVLAGLLAFAPHDSKASAAFEAAQRPVRRIAPVGPAGSRLALLSDDTCRLHDRAGSEDLVVWSRSGEVRVTALAGSPTDARLLLGHSDGRVRMLDAASLDTIWERRADAGPIHAAAYSPDGRLIAFTSPGAVHLVTVDGKPSRTFAVPGDVRCLRFTPDGGRLLYTPGDGTLAGFDPSTGRETCRIPVARSVIALDAAPDGRRAAVGTDDGRVLLVDLAAGRVIARRQPSPTAVMSIAFLGDHRLATASLEGPIRLFSTADLVPVRALRGHPAGTRALTQAADTLFSGGFDGRVLAWNLETGAARDLLDP